MPETFRKRLIVKFINNYFKDEDYTSFQFAPS